MQFSLDALRVRTWTFIVLVLLASWFLHTSALAHSIRKDHSGRTCHSSQVGCVRMTLRLLNRDRARVDVPPLSLMPLQSRGTGGCVGSYGHSEAMAASGFVWHSNPSYLRASFPQNICVAARIDGQNAGMFRGKSVAADLKALDAMMMHEAHSRSTCMASVNHACNILDPAFRRVGIGIYVADGATWLTEDFLG